MLPQEAGEENGKGLVAMSIEVSQSRREEDGGEADEQHHLVDEQCDAEDDAGRDGVPAKHERTSADRHQQDQRVEVAIQMRQHDEGR